MKKLIKKSDYYYVINDEIAIETEKYILVISKYNGGKISYIRTCKNNMERVEFKPTNQPAYMTGLKSNYIPVIATTDKSINLPQITNPSDELELMVDKEVEVEISYHIFTNSKGELDATTDSYDAIIKPISKETCNNCSNQNGINCTRNLHTCKAWQPVPKATKPFRLPDDDIFGETSTNETLLQFPSNNLKEMLKEETLEKVAEKYADFCKGSMHYFCVQDAFIAGAKWQEKQIYSEDEVKELFNKFFKGCIYSSGNPDLIAGRFPEWFEKNKK